MNDENPLPRRRAVTSVDLTDLRERVEELSQGKVSTWIRDLVRKELGQTAEPRRGAGVYRAWLDAELTAKLDERCRAHGFQSRAAALRAAIEGVGVGDRLQVPGSDGGSLKEAVDALAASNFQLVAVGRNVNQIAKERRMAESHGRERLADALALDRAQAAILKHLEDAAAVVAFIRPMLARSIDSKRWSAGATDGTR